MTKSNVYFVHKSILLFKAVVIIEIFRRLSERLLHNGEVKKSNTVSNALIETVNTCFTFLFPIILDTISFSLIQHYFIFSIFLSNETQVYDHVSKNGIS